MSYTSDTDIMNRLQEHLEFALDKYPNKDWFVIALQGSQNYGMSDENSDIDTKLLILPNMEDLVLDKAAISHTVVLPNDEHCDVKDTRNYFHIFRKSNINFVEILFTDYWIANPRYQDLWLELRARNEELARINPYAAVSCMKGMAIQKRKALFHKYPSKIHIIEKYGYDPKQLSHLLRIDYFIDNYVHHVPYWSCIRPIPKYRDQIIECKRTGWYLTPTGAEEEADRILKHIIDIADKFIIGHKNENDLELDKFLDSILYRIMERNIRSELNE